MDPIARYKQMQRESWVNFGKLQSITTPTAARLIRHARVEPGARLLDAGCGTGVVAVTAARLGAHSTGLDLTPELLEQARENARVAGVAIEFHEGDVEQLPFPGAHFDFVLSQFAHMFAPRPDVAIAEMLRVLKPGGTIAFSTWPPELLVGRTREIAARYMPPLPGIDSPMLWGDPNIVRQRLGDAVTGLVFDRDSMSVPALSPAHFRLNSERTAGPIVKLVESLAANDPARLEAFRREFDAIIAEYFRDNIVRQDYLLTRAMKRP